MCADQRRPRAGPKGEESTDARRSRLIEEAVPFCIALVLEHMGDRDDGKSRFC